VFRILNQSLLDEILRMPPEIQRRHLFIEPSQYQDYWQVSSFYEDDDFRFDLANVTELNSYGCINTDSLLQFVSICENNEYIPVFTQPPDISTVEVPFTIQSSLDNTQGGFLPWQVEGYNKLIRRELPGAYAVWDVGTGKTVLPIMLIKEYEGRFDVCLIVVKSHNKIDTQRKLYNLGGIESVIIDGPKKKRLQAYQQLTPPFVLIINYEKLREDTEEYIQLVSNRRCLFCWDEISNKLSNSQTQLYRAVKRVLYKSFHSKPRPSWMRHIGLSATPIENSPGDLWSAFNIMNPKILGTKGQFEMQYVKTRNFWGEPVEWHSLDKLSMSVGHAVHVVSKSRPEIVRMFPEAQSRPIFVDWSNKHRALYDKLTSQISSLLTATTNMLPLIQVMQMLCDAPSMVQMSAQNREKFYEMLQSGVPDLGDQRGSDAALALVNMIADFPTDEGHAKLDTWREIICEKHPDEKIVTHSTWAEYIFPIWEEYLQKWGVSYVIFAGSDSQKQSALDRFRNDPSIRVFLSGDNGSDSIDIAEASVGVNYNTPWKWTTLQQREGRRNRVNSEHDRIYTYSLIMPNSVDERKLLICERKRQYHEKIFANGTRSVFDDAITRDELKYILIG